MAETPTGTDLYHAAGRVLLRCPRGATAMNYRSCRSRTAFTLIELLVVIAIISILMGLLLPAIGAARHTARVTVGLANLRSVGLMLQSYTMENHDAYPNPFRPVWPDEMPGGPAEWTDAVSVSDPEVRWSFRTICPLTHLDAFSSVWYSYLSEYRGSPRSDPVQYSPADSDLLANARDAMAGGAPSENQLFGSTFLYSATLWSRPERFPGTNEEMSPALLRVNTVADIVHPSSKVILWERAEFRHKGEDFAWTDPRAKVNVHLADLSIVAVEMRDVFSEPASNSHVPDVRPSYTGCPANSLLPFQCTLGGVKGRDLARN